METPQGKGSKAQCAQNYVNLPILRLFQTLLGPCIDTDNAHVKFYLVYTNCYRCDVHKVSVVGLVFF